MKIVLRIAGSILGSPPSSKIVTGYAKVVSLLLSKGNSIGVVVGGGPICRKYIESAKEMGLPRFQQDTIGLKVARLNAKLVAMKLGIMRPVPETIEKMVGSLRQNKVEVMGGLKPGMTTDNVSVLLAERWEADLLLKGTDQDGIYTADPRKDKSAKKLDIITHARMKEILSKEYAPGMHSIVDPVAVKRLTKSKIKLIVLNGRTPKNVVKAVYGRRVGTLVVSPQ